MSAVCVCVLAHNEEKNIRRSLIDIYYRNLEIEFDFKLYANGCTDDTVQIARNLTTSIPRLEVYDLPVPSKPLAWNTAFYQNNHDILVFTDADISVDPGTVKDLCDQLNRDNSTVIVSTTFHPLSKGLPFQKRAVGFMQMPVAQDFQYGGFYAVRREALATIFDALNIMEMPLGMAGEDVFLEYLIGVERLRVSSKKCYYEPPNIDEYCAYLARVKWQSSQVEMFFKNSDANRDRSQDTTSAKFFRKLRLLATSPDRAERICAFVTRSLFKCMFARRIVSFSKAIGPVTYDGAWVLSGISRSKSCK